MTKRRDSVRMNRTTRPRHFERIGVTPSMEKEHREDVASAHREADRIIKKIKPLLKESLKKVA